MSLSLTSQKDTSTVRKEQQDRILSLFREGEPLTQRQVAELLRVTVSAASKSLRYLYESGKLRVETRPGHAMRYYKVTSGVLRSPGGKPLSEYYVSDCSVDMPFHWLELVKAVTTKTLNGEFTHADLVGFRDTAKGLILLSEILINATPEEIAATRKAAGDQSK